MLYVFNIIFNINRSFAHTYVGFQQKRCNTNPEIKEMISEMLFIKQPKKYNIFVCDDEKQIALSVQNLILKYFKKRKLFDSLPEIYLMRDGIECLFQAYQFYLEDNQCNLIILDQNMDFLKGEETCKILKRIKQLENIKVFLMTGENPDTFDNCSADGIITKPLSFTTIENILKLQNFK